MSRARSSDSGKGALDLVEEATHLLRSAPLRVLICYYLGTAPFVLGLLFFWSDMSRSPFARQYAAVASLGMAALFVWMKCWQSIFARRLRDYRTGQSEAFGSWSGVARSAGTQALVQATGLFLIPVALLIVLPFGWVFAFYQSATVMALTDGAGLRETVRRAAAQASLQPRENHVVLMVLAVFGCFVLLNLFTGLAFGSRLAKSFFGTESVFTHTPWALLNTTVLAGLLGLAWLIVDPLVKAVHVLRCFRGESLSTGADLRAELRRIQRRSATLPALISALWLMAGPGATGAGADATTPVTRLAVSAAAVAPEALNRSIDEVLQRVEFRWRMPRELGEAPSGAAPGFARQVVQTAMRWLRAAGRAIGRVLDWLLEKLGRQGAEREPGVAGGDWPGVLRVILLFLLVGLASALGVLLYRAFATRRRKTVGVSADAVQAAPDIGDEETVANQLPEDGWLELARQLLARGEARLALRALHLAALAHLAAHGLVSIARFKSNRDYERELHRRSHATGQVHEAFNRNVGLIDRVWYGTHPVTPELVEAFTLNLERIRSC